MEESVAKKRMALKTKIKFFVVFPVQILVILLLVFVVFLQIFIPSKVIEIFGVQAYMVSYTGSMEPKLHYNDLIIVRKYDFDSIKEGDTVTFFGKTLDGKTIAITHEVVEIFFDTETNQRYLRTKGINKEYPDYIPVSEDGASGTNKYIGKYAGKSEFFGNFFAYLSSPPGLSALAFNSACVLALYIFLRKYRHPPTTPQPLDEEAKEGIEEIEAKEDIDGIKTKEDIKDEESIKG